MSDTLWNQSLASFREAIASTEPTPGGGSVAMVSATFGIGLVIMALEITAKKPEPETEQRLRELLEEARGRLAELSAHADEDVAAFQRYMAALKMPKATDEEKAARKEAMQTALIRATEAPLAAARSCLAALIMAEEAATISSVRVVSDVGAGATLLGGAVSAVLLNVEINLPSIADPALKEEFSRAREELLVKVKYMTELTMECVGSRLKEG
jgi:formiminotetrahydrofolate cyclodeaminase